MEFNGKSEYSVDSADWKKICLEPPVPVLSGDSKYLTQLWVSKKEEPLEQQFIQSDLVAINPNVLRSREEVRATLKLLTLLKERVIVQYWSPLVYGKRQFLTTADQPFGLGVVDDDGLRLYRLHSVGNLIYVDKDHKEEDHSPVARVFRRGMPEWTSDLTNYSPSHFPQQECAVRCDLHGYLALPMFDSTTGLCVGVLELLTSSEHMDYAYEVQQVHKALKTINPTSLQAFDFRPSEVFDKCKQNELYKIFSILKVVCEAHRVPLAQTWAISPHGSYVSHEKVLKKSCSSFDTKCTGKVCMYTDGLAFHVRDLSKWKFRKACEERHLEISKGVTGVAMRSRGSCFCGDVTKFGEDEYPLVHNACMSRLTSCFAIFLHSVKINVDYVLEFFLTLDIKHCREVLSLVQTLEDNFNAASGFELGDKSTIQEVGPPPMDLSTNMEPDTTHTSNCMADNFSFGLTGSSDSETLVADIARNGFVNVEDQLSPSDGSINESCVTCIGIEGNCNTLKHNKKRKRDSHTTTSPMEVEVTFNMDTKKFLFPVSPGLSNLKKAVAERFKLLGKDLSLKYTDEENDLISIPGDDDLKLAFSTVGRNNRINLRCICEYDILKKYQVSHALE